ncbi:MAG TPA: hypothetical protein DCY48_01980 [Candidatus Magasanikbacteria bacterium]|nr:MAG: hypothetical protein A3I74_00890 [Candidatus Magasanikbacteria bacterium RIFCSPLOWO2_02_FULL_47_16]OGH79998.1 MAG: hypothetical protein A3C10_02335 [Candidatus Magasanikbacteria bacterium RIFCSPHIGHO2_02_FULL_48_18]OGH83473.1 MAG: hypothetical protein A3G08_04070 [Candidatus Magasanikbacteria bacterium RIFCSPLOWO2_12_FULL_47_9b]HAZ28525.1 hypothetical protein [Candidatus Magasanikbacteria bacterium]
MLPSLPHPFSPDIIFFDTEFSDLDTRTGSLLSLGMVKPNGKELYIEFEHDGQVHPWVEKHVLPTLTQQKISHETAQGMIRRFIGTNKKKKPYLMAYVNQFDAIFWYQLFGSPQHHPAFWIPIDFASILFAHGIDPNSMGKQRFFDWLGVDKKGFTLHNALDDARLLKVTYEKFWERI